LAAYNQIYGTDKVFEKGDFYSFGRLPKTGEGSVFTARTAAEHRDHRRRVQATAVTGTRIASYKPVIAKNITILLQHIDDELKEHRSTVDALTSSLSSSAAVSLGPLIQLFATNLNFELIHGSSLADLPAASLAQAQVELRNVSKFSFGFAYLPLLNWIASSSAGRAIIRRPKRDPRTGEAVGMTALFERSRDIVFMQKERVAAPDAQPCMLQAFMQVPETDKARHMDAPLMARECINLIFAGRGSVAAGVTVVLHALGSEQGRKWQERVRAELTSDHGGGGGGGGPQQNMSPTLLAVIKETLRLKPPFPRGFPREVAPGGGVLLPGMDAPLPGGTMVYSSNYVIGRSQEIWGDDAAEWKPERWLETGGDQASIDTGFVAFGKGARSCIGREVAMMAISDVVERMLKKWEIKGEGELEGEDAFEMRYDICQMKLVARA
jgi:cytochrome P450